MLGKQSILTTRRQDQGQTILGSQPSNSSSGSGTEDLRGFPTPATVHSNRSTEPDSAPLIAPQPLVTTETSPVQPKRLTVGNGVRLKSAAIEDCDTLIVEGQVEATIDCSTLQIATDGVYRGKATVHTAEIEGRFEGELYVHERLILRSSGHIQGKICYGKLLVEEGGVLGGEISTLDAEQEKRSQSSVTRLSAPAVPVAVEQRSAG